MSNFEMTGKTTSDFEQPQTGMVSAVCINQAKQQAILNSLKLVWYQLFVSMLQTADM